MVQRITKTVDLRSGDPEQKRQELLDYFHASYDIDEKLFETLKRDETFYLRADPLRHPLIFYFGHTAVFYINKLILSKIIDTRLNPTFESIFAVGVDEMSWDDLNEAHYDWPSVDAVRAYRNQVRQLVDHLIRTLPLSMPIDWQSPFWIIMMGIEHSRIHLETSSVLMRHLPLEEVVQTDFWDYTHQWGPAPDNDLIAVEGGTVELGKAHTHPLYGWDNEYGSKTEVVHPFAASRYLVSNHEFMQFVQAGGYSQPQWWTDEGWRWKEFEQASSPRFWRQTPGGWKLRLMAIEIEMPWNWPVEVNYLEAKAFTNWLAEQTGTSLRLPTEAEWLHLHQLHGIPDQPQWQQAPGNINLEYQASPCPVDRFAFGEFFDLIGNVWQWTEMPIAGYPGFAVHPSYDDFSTPTFDNRHNLIKGGSWISTGNEATTHARYAFRRHFYQHAGFRYIESSAPVTLPDDMYEEEADVTPWCDMHWGAAHFGVPNFQQALASWVLDATAGEPRELALSIGCKVGRTAFELARQYQHVTGLDFTARHLKAGVAMRDKGLLRYTLKEENELISFHEVQLAEFGLAATAQRVEFYQGDISNLVPKYSGYDLIVVENALELAYNPAAFLLIVHQRLNPGGTLLIAASWHWQDGITAPEHRLGGFRKDGEPYTALDAITEILQQHFTLAHGPRDMPWVLRQDARNYRHGVSQITLWKKHSYL